MRNSTLLCRRALLWIASKMLEILTRILRRIFFRVFRVIRGFNRIVLLFLEPMEYQSQ